MNIEELSISELIDLKRQTERAIFKNANYKMYRQTQEEKKFYLMLYAKDLILYLTNELGYNIMNKNRKIHLTFPRYCIFYYLRSEGLTLQSIADIFNIHHSSIIHGIRMYENLLKYNDAEFGIYQIKINHLITQFKQDGKQESFKSIGEFSEQN